MFHLLEFQDWLVICPKFSRLHASTHHLPPRLLLGDGCQRREQEPILCDPCSIRPKAVGVDRQQHEVDVGIHAGGSTSLRADQATPRIFRCAIAHAGTT